MKTIIMTISGGVLVLLLASAGISKDIALLNISDLKNEVNSGANLMLYGKLENSIGGPGNDKILRVRDIKVYEVEEEINLDFNTKDYLPSGFNPVEGLELNEELDYEASLIFNKVYGDAVEDETLSIEDIKLYQVEQI